MIALGLMSNFALLFSSFLIILILLKIALTIYRIVSGKWPVSAKYLWKIINWRVEAYKILFLVTLAFLVTILVRQY